MQPRRFIRPDIYTPFSAGYLPLPGTRQYQDFQDWPNRNYYDSRTLPQQMILEFLPGPNPGNEEYATKNAGKHLLTLCDPYEGMHFALGGTPTKGGFPRFGAMYSELNRYVVHESEGATEDDWQFGRWNLTLGLNWYNDPEWFVTFQFHHLGQSLYHPAGVWSMPDYLNPAGAYSGHFTWRNEVKKNLHPFRKNVYPTMYYLPADELFIDRRPFNVAISVKPYFGGRG